MQKFDLEAIKETAEAILGANERPNKRECCNALIYACIEAEMTAGDQIVASVHMIAPDLKKGFIGILLKKPLKDASDKPFWRKDPIAGYVLN
ncbi:hypothetical protein [Sphingomonas sp. Root710]|uniref:hypothetical protein n=1 Tax=Sphingomonas sp. Root710 TaxID=1736594 RepID=UPI0012E3A13D|nr:hypothetical protein [Sphingomonas sp. Root710]